MEIQNFGWHGQTYIFLATILITIIQVWGFYKQADKIWELGSGKSVSVSNVSISIAYFCSSIVYGFHAARIALIFSGVVAGVVFIWMFVGLTKYKKFTGGESVLSYLAASYVGAVIFLEQGSGNLFLIISFITAVCGFLQPYEMFKNRHAGSVEIKTYLVVLPGAAFWTIYAFVTNDWVLSLVCPMFLLAHTCTISLYFIYRRKSLQPA